MINLPNTRYNSISNIFVLVFIVIMLHFLIHFIYHLFVKVYLFFSSDIHLTDEVLFMTPLLHTTIPIPSLAHMFFIDHVMPCCGKDVNAKIGPRGGDSINIECFHCRQKWNICPPWYIEKI